MLKIESTALDGVHILTLPHYTDIRGSFVKVFHQGDFTEQGLATNFSEQFVTVSQKNVLRGMHFQMPPHEHVKLVTCVAGEILDVILDLRRDQPTYGKSITVKLDATQGLAIYIPKGCAHGFLTISPDALTLYNVTSVHAPSSDSGLHWQSIGLDWPVGDPIISDRDKSLPSLHDFKSPF